MQAEEIPTRSALLARGGAILPNPGKQERFVACAASEALYGGAAGAGKSYALLFSALRYRDRPDYHAVLFRRTVPQLKMAGGLLQRAFGLFPAAGGSPRFGGFTWVWPSGARIDLRSMDHEADRFNYLGSEYSFIGWDELTMFTLEQYLFMFTRLRTTSDIPTRVRAATNPGGIGHDWVLDRFGPWLYPKGHPEWTGAFAEPEERLWFAYSEEEQREVVVPKGTPGAFSRTCFPALLKDNPPLAATNYAHQLNRLDPLTRQQQKFGDWMAKPTAGLFFKRDWMPIVDEAPEDREVVARARLWDRAATEERPGTSPDWTVGTKGCITRGGDFIAEDVERFRGNPGEVVKRIKATADADREAHGVRCTQVLLHDPGQAGKVEIQVVYAKALEGHAWTSMPERGDKVENAKPLSAAAEHGKMKLVRGPWNEGFRREHEAFPDGKFDDQVDTSSKLYVYLTRHATRGVSKAGSSNDNAREYARTPGGY